MDALPGGIVGATEVAEGGATEVAVDVMLLK